MNFEELLKQVTNDFRSCRRINNDVIYHYTSPDGLKSIIENGSLWFGDARFLNDSNEIDYATNLLKDRIEKKKDSIKPMYYKRIKEICEDPIGYLSKISFATKDLEGAEYGIEDGINRFYICSFSKLSDSLPMWNYYSKTDSKSGYCIGFKTDMLLSILKGNIPYLRNETFGQVIYNKEIQYKLIDDLISLLTIVNSEQEFSKIQSYIINYIIFFKSDNFSNEEEVRVIFMINKKIAFNSIKCNFPIVMGVISPKLEVATQELLESMEEIIIGPYNSKELSELGLNELLSYKKMSVNIKISSNNVRF